MFEHKAKLKEQASYSYCAVCGNKFKQGIYEYKGRKFYKKNLTCSKSCLKQTYKQRSRNNPDLYWSEAEEQLLIKWIQIKPAHLIYDDWNDVAKINNWKERSRHTLCFKAARLIKTEPILKDNYIAQSGNKNRIHVSKDNWSLQDLKRILGIRRYGRVLRWAHKKGLQYEDVSSPQQKYYMVSRKALRDFARRHPEEFWGIERKNLAKVLPRPLANKLYKIHRERQPTNGRAIPVIRLDTGDVYRSGSAAASACNLSVSNVILSAKTDKVLIDGADFFRFDYPVYWIPPDVREEFNLTAGKVLYQLYLQIVQVTGYSKQSCLTVAARIAVHTTLCAFRRREKAHLLNNKCDSIEVLTQMFAELFIKKLTYIFNLQSGSIMTKIVNVLKRRIRTYCYAACGGDRLLTEEYSIEFANFFIQRAIKSYYDKSYLPINYHPSDKLQHADLWTYIYGSINISFWIGSEKNNSLKCVYWWFVSWLKFQEKHPLKLNESKTVKMIDDWQQHNSPNATPDNYEFENRLDDLLSVAKQIYKQHTYEQLSMFVALKLEDASDREIADCMDINILQIPKMLSQLAKCAE